MTGSSSGKKWLTLATVCFGLFMINLDGNVVNLAMPTIIRQFHANLSQMEWISNAYLLTFAVFLITLGRLGDQVGRKKLFLSGMVLFTLGSALCGAAQGVGQLIAFRVVQGIGGSAMMPATLSLLTATFPREERGRAMGFWGAVSGLAFIMGPVIGGYLTQSGLGEALNSFIGIREFWRFVFFINVPFGALAFVLGLAVVKESRDDTVGGRPDIVGVILASCTVFLLTFGFVEGPRHGWLLARRELVVAGLAVHPLGLSIVPIMLVLALVLGVIFLRYEKGKRVDPLVDLSLFANRNYSVGMTAGVILNFALMGAIFLVPLYCQSVLGIDPIHTGTLMLPFALALLVASPLAGLLSDHIGGKYVLIVGMVILAFSSVLMARFQVDTRAVQLILPFVVMGIGMGLSMTPLTNLTLDGVVPQKAGGASGVLSTTRQIGAVMGVAIFSVILQARMVDSMEVNAGRIPGMPPAAQKVLVGYVAGGGLYGFSDEAGKGLASRLAAAAPQVKDLSVGVDHAMKQSFTDSINATFLMSALVGAGAVGVAFMMKGKRRQKRDGEADSQEEAA